MVSNLSDWQLQQVKHTYTTTYSELGYFPVEKTHSRQMNKCLHSPVTSS